MKKQTESGWAIPDDWNGEDWTCYAIQWPDSPKFKLLLRSLLYSLSRGRDWDRQTGTITAATLIGWDIFDRNSPLIDCSASPECPECPDCDTGGNGGNAGSGGGIVILEEEDMGQVVTDVQLIGSVLRVYFGHCCYEDYDLAGLAAEFPGELPPDVVNPDEDPEFEYSSCGKAKGIVEAIYTIVTAAYTAVETKLPWQYIGFIESAVGYNLDNNWCAVLLIEVPKMIILGIDSGDVNNAVYKQAIINRIAQILPADGTGVPDEETFNQIVHAFDVIPLLALYRPLFYYACDALGRHDMDTIAKLSAADLTAECAEVPNVNPFEGLGEEMDWRYVYDFRSGLHGWSIDGDDHQDTTGLWSDNQVTDHKAQITATKNLDNNNNGSTILLVALMWETMGDEGWLVSGTNVGTDEGALIGQAQIIGVCGDSPSAAGTWTYGAAVNIAINTNFANFAAGLQASHDTNVSQRLVSVMFAGSGPGPMNDPAG